MLTKHERDAILTALYHWRKNSRDDLIRDEYLEDVNNLIERFNILNNEREEVTYGTK